MSVFYDLNKTPRNILNRAIVRAIVSENNGAWFDPSDLSTLYQDAAGTTPVTAVEQPVGKMLDKSGNGYHATQSITASRPTLSARYNLLTKTEDFSDAVWTKANSTNPTYPPVVTPDAAIGPDGITYADLVTPANIAGCSFIEVYQNSTIISGTKYHQYYCVKPNGWRYLQSVGNRAVFSLGYVNFDLVTGTVTENAPDTGGFSGDITPLANGWFLLHVSATAIANGTSHLSINFIDSATASRGQVATGNGVDGVYVTRGDFRAAAEQNSYQRVNTSTDYDTDERYFPKYLRFDGIDDYLSLPYMGLYANGSASVVAAITVSPSTWSTILAEGGGGNGGLYILARYTGTNKLGTFIRDDNVNKLQELETPITRGITTVFSVVDAGSAITHWVSSRLAGSSNYTRSGTLTNAVTFVGAIPYSDTLNGNLYSLIITKSALTDSQRIACERHLSRKSGVQL